MQVKSPQVGLAFLLSQVGAHAAARFGDLLIDLGITPQHAGLLRMLGSNAGMTQQALAKLFGIFPSRLVILVDELEAKKLISRRSSPNDRRSYRLHLTPSGRRCLLAIGQLTDDLEADLFVALTPTERKQLRSSLVRLAEQQQLISAVHPAYRQLRSQRPRATTQGEPMRQRFVARIHQAKDKNATGIVVPPEIVEALGSGKKPPVKVTINGHTYRSTVATMGGRFMVGVSAENRKAAGVEGGQDVEVCLELDSEPRIIPIPTDLRAALSKAKVLEAFDNAAPSRRKEFVRQVEDAKTPETRERRISKVVAALS